MLLPERFWQNCQAVFGPSEYCWVMIIPFRARRSHWQVTSGLMILLEITLESSIYSQDISRGVVVWDLINISASNIYQNLLWSQICKQNSQDIFGRYKHTWVKISPSDISRLVCLCCLVIFSYHHSCYLCHLHMQKSSLSYVWGTLKKRVGKPFKKLLWK